MVLSADGLLVFAKTDAMKETVTIGEIVTLGSPVAPALNFTGARWDVESLEA